jgi:predicted phage terminase large subunit-like protein
MNLHAPHLRTSGAFRAWTQEDIDLYDRYYCALARDDFFAYRRYIDPTLIVGWYQQRVAKALMRFHDMWMQKKRPVLVLEAPPQHGKSRQVHDFISWVTGKHPAMKTIYTSYSDDLGLVANTRLQRIFSGDKFINVFPELGEVWRSGEITKNSYHLEFGEGKGEFRNTTVLGQITGMGLELGVIDDPLKGRKEANSPQVRQNTWTWFTDDFFSRFTDTAALLMIMTRWHTDDPAGRFMEKYPEAIELKFPALGRFTADGRWVMDDSKNGCALFPEFKGEEFIRKRKTVLSQASWMSLYQQSPITVGGDMFPIDKFRIAPQVPRKEIVKSVRYWDKAGTERRKDEKGSRTAGVLMHKMHDGTFLIENVVSGAWKSLEREKVIKNTSETDSAICPFLDIYVEQEPGSGGKESAENTIRMLAGKNVFADRVTGDKATRADPYSAQVQQGNVLLLAADWNQTFIDEHETFPNGPQKDKVDAASGAFNKLTGGSSYDTSMSWV